MTWFSLGPFYIQILYSFTWLLVCCWFWSHSCIVTIKLNNQTNISANQTQIFTQINLYCMYNMCPKCARGNGAAGRQLEKSYVAPVVYAKCTPFYFVNNDLCMPEIYLVLSCLVLMLNVIKRYKILLTDT